MFVEIVSYGDTTPDGHQLKRLTNMDTGMSLFVFEHKPNKFSLAIASSLHKMDYLVAGQSKEDVEKAYAKIKASWVGNQMIVVL